MKNNKVLENYKAKQEEWKDKIRKKGNHWYSWLWYLVAFPFVWLFYNIRDWRTAVIFVITFLVVSSEVWAMYLLYFITKNAWFLGIGSACWVFWLGPGTPFLPLCIGITIGIKSIFNKINKRNKDDEK